MTVIQPAVDSGPSGGRTASRPPAAAALERARGTTRLAARAEGGRTLLSENYQSGSAKLRFPRPPSGDPFTAVLVNTAGGITGGDRFSWSVAVGANASATVAGQAAERIYRRTAGDATVETVLAVAEGGALDWLPQETILFDRSSLNRTLTADLAPSARLLAVESIVLGRTAMGEATRDVTVRDSWRIRRGGRLVFADGLRFDGDTTLTLAGAATGNGAHALATVVLVAPEAESAIDRARAALIDSAGEAGVSAWNGMLVARLIATGGQALRADVTRLIETLSGRPMPRVWNC
jgi:urease accessory protein